MAQKEHNATLDGLRGVAAVAVCFYHMNFFLKDFRQPPIHGNLAVDFFFILSGFVLMRAYDDRLRTEMSVSRFVTLRIIRLFPLILLGMALGLVIFGSRFHAGELVAIVVTGLLMLPIQIAHHPFFPLDNPLWSLLYEFWVNVLYAFIAKYRRLVAALAGFGAVLILYITLKGHHHIGVGNTYQTLWIGIGRILWGFFAGVIISRALTPQRIARLPSIPFSVLAALLLIILINVGTGPWYDDLCVFVLFPALVALGAKDVASGRWRTVALFAGAMSYPLYVLHQPLVSEITHFRSHANIAGLLLFGVVVAVSYAAIKWYDEPIRGWLGARTRRNISKNAVQTVSAD